MNMVESSLEVQKTLWEKEKLLFTSNFPFSHSVFERLVLQTIKNQGLFGKGLKKILVYFLLKKYVKPLSGLKLNSYFHKQHYCMTLVIKNGRNLVDNNRFRKIDCWHCLDQLYFQFVKVQIIHVSTT